MKRVVHGLCVGLIWLAGCASESAPPNNGDSSARTGASLNGDPPSARSANATAGSGAAKPAQAQANPDRVVARINNEPISMNQLLGPLIESHGLDVLINLVQVEMARQDAAKAGVTVTSDDFKQERAETLAKLFKENDDKTQDQIDAALHRKDEATAKRLREEMQQDHESLLNQFLEQQHISATEFDLVLQINTYLRKIAEPAVNKSITEESLKNAFNQLYGEKVRVRYIQLHTPLEVAQVQRRLAQGEKFDDLAGELSTNRQSAALKGELPAFSRETNGIPPTFKDAAFLLKPGEVSDMVEANGSYCLIKLIDRIPPRVVKFEQQRENVRHELTSRAIQAAVKDMRENLIQELRQGLKIEDPVLEKQYDARIQKFQKNEIRDQQRIRDEWDRQHKHSATLPSSPDAGSTTGPTLPVPATQPAATRAR